jgi:hypothetical protein
MSRHFLLLTACAAVIALCSCASTPFTSTWTAPDVRSLNPAGKTIAVVFISRDEKARRAGEDALAEDLTAHKAHGVAAYSVLPNEQREGGEAARALLKQAGMNGIVLMRVVGKEQRVAYAREYAVLSSYAGLAPYWDYGWSTLSEARDRQSDTPLSVETLVYSLDQGGKLVWASTSHTIDPRNLDSMVKGIADATVSEMFRSRRGPMVDYAAAPVEAASQ